MNCNNYKEQFAHWMNNQMAGVDRVALESHLLRCPECRQELEAHQQVWKLMGKMPVPEPSDVMQIRFDTMLDTYKKTVPEKRSSWRNIFQGIRESWILQPGIQLAYTIALLAIGLVSGLLFHPPTPKTNADRIQINALSAQVQEMRQGMMLSLLENPSASERIRAVSYTNDIHTVNNQVAEALLTTLNNDPNVNVRLLTLEALANFANDPHIREGLVHSIIQQESPLVQSAMADVMVKLQEKRSIEPFKKLLQQKDLNSLVRSKIEQSINELI